MGGSGSGAKLLFILLGVIVVVTCVVMLGMGIMVSGYAKENATDAIELKNGKVIIGKVIGETPKNYFVKSILGPEEKIDRAMAANTRAPSDAELKSVMVLLAKNPSLMKNKSALTAAEKAAARRAAEERYNNDVATAKQARENMEAALAAERKAAAEAARARYPRGQTSDEDRTDREQTSGGGGGMVL